MSTKRALALTDDPQVLRVLSEALPLAGFEIVLDEGGGAAPDESPSLRPDMAVIDADFSDLTPADFWAGKGRDKPGIPVILIAGRSHDVSSPLFGGAAAVLSKPLDLPKFRAAAELIAYENSASEGPGRKAGAEEFPSPPEAPEVPAGLVPETGEKPAGQEVSPEWIAAVDRIVSSALNEIEKPKAEPRIRKNKRAPAEFPVFAPPERRKTTPAGPIPGVRERIDPQRPRSLGPGGKPRLRIVLASGFIAALLGGAWYLGFEMRASSAPAERPSRLASGPAAGARRPRAGLKAGISAAAVFLKPAITPVAVGSPDEPRLESILAGLARDSAALPAKPAENPPAAGAKPPESSTPAPPAAEGKAEAADKGEPAALKDKRDPAPESPRVDATILETPLKTTRSGDLVELASADAPPILLRSYAPAYPALALQNRLQARLTISIIISETGAVLDAGVVGAPAVDLGFANAALKAVRRWVFAPARKDGVPVRVRKEVVISFRLR